MTDVIFFFSITLFSTYYLRLRQNQRKLHISKNRQFLLKHKDKYQVKFNYFIRNRWINNEFKLETECSLTAFRLAYEFTGIHCLNWIKTKNLNLNYKIFLLFFWDYSENSMRFGHQVLIKDNKIYQSYIDIHRLKITDLTEEKKSAIYNKNHKLFAFGKYTNERSYKVEQLIPYY